MPDTPTPAPALTDEQIEELWRDLYITVAGCSERLIDPQDLDPLLAAVVARAKREALRDVKQAVEDGFPPYGSELRFDGSEDRELAAYGSGMRDALSLALGTGGRI